MAVVEQLGDDCMWYVAACCYMALVFVIIHLFNISKFCILSIHILKISFFNLVLIN